MSKEQQRWNLTWQESLRCRASFLALYPPDLFAEQTILTVHITPSDISSHFHLFSIFLSPQSHKVKVYFSFCLFFVRKQDLGSSTPFQTPNSLSRSAVLGLWNSGLIVITDVTAKTIMIKYIRRTRILNKPRGNDNLFCPGVNKVDVIYIYICWHDL